MKKISAFLVMLALAVSFTACGKKKTMTPEDFIKIQTEFLSSDLTEESKSTIAKKFGYTADQYTAYDEKVESDPQLKQKLGELLQKNQK